MKPVSKEKVKKLVSEKKDAKAPDDEKKKTRSASEVRKAMYGNKE